MLKDLLPSTKDLIDEVKRAVIRRCPYVTFVGGYAFGRHFVAADGSTWSRTKAYARVPIAEHDVADGNVEQVRMSVLAGCRTLGGEMADHIAAQEPSGRGVDVRWTGNVVNYLGEEATGAPVVHRGELRLAAYWVISPAVPA